MKFKAHMLAFNERGVIRSITVPDSEYNACTTREEVLNLIYHYGQNDFQPQRCYSVSVGDVIEVDGAFHAVSPVGFREVSEEEFKAMSGNRSMKEMFK